MKGGEFDIDEMMLDYAVVRLALEYLVYATSEGIDVDKYYQNARKALLWTKTLIEYGEDCEDCQ